MPETLRLTRSTTHRMIAGVCGGLSEYFHVDVTLIRVVAVVLAFWHGLGILLYIVMWLMVPLAGAAITTVDQSVQQVGQEMRQAAQKFSGDRRRSLGAIVFGTILILIGLNSILGQFWSWRWIHLDLWWPLVIIAAGFLILIRRR